eukprot:8018303-Pyramimonas_sp.AAC.1
MGNRTSKGVSTQASQAKKPPSNLSGVGFYSYADGVWDEGGRPHRVLQDRPRYNPPQELLPLPFEFYGQPFFKGFKWETKV